MAQLDRRQFVKAAAAAAALAASSLEAFADTTCPLAGKPNILYIFADQHRAMSVNSAGAVSAVPAALQNTDVYTPNISGLRDNGFAMTSCCSNYPLCAPHRAILLSGNYPHVNGVTSNDDTPGYSSPTLIPANNPDTLTEIFAANGYSVGYVGKWHLAQHYGVPNPTVANSGRFGIAEWDIWYNTDDHYDNGTGSTTSTSSYWYYQTDVETSTSKAGTFTPRYRLAGSTVPAKQAWNPYYMTMQAQAFLSSQKDATPFFLMVAYNPPHPPFDAPGNSNYAPGSASTQRGNMMAHTQDGTTADSGVPAWMTTISGTTSILQEQFIYNRGIADVDGEIGKILSHLTATQLANTIIIYTSDHGELMGSHARKGKQYPYEESVRVPFFVQGPCIPKGQASDILFSSIDLLPTVCGLAGLWTDPTKYAAKGGVNFASVIRGNATQPGLYKDHVFLLSGDGAAQSGSGDDTNTYDMACPVYRGLRTAQYTYCVVADNNNSYPMTNGYVPQGRWLLFDNTVSYGGDPTSDLQTHNLLSLVDQTGYPTSAMLAAWDAQLAKWIGSTGDRFVSTLLGTNLPAA